MILGVQVLHFKARTYNLEYNLYVGEWKMSESYPWYVRQGQIQEYKETLTKDKEPFPVLKTLKIIRAIIVNVGIFGIGFYAISLGGDPTIISLAVLGIAGGYNGLELSDYLALLQALQEVEVENKD